MRVITPKRVIKYSFITAFLVQINQFSIQSLNTHHLVCHLELTLLTGGDAALDKDHVLNLRQLTRVRGADHVLLAIANQPGADFLSLSSGLAYTHLRTLSVL